MNAAEITALVQLELKKINDPLVQSTILSLLISPSLHQRTWEWDRNENKFPCWTTIQDNRTDTSIVYCEHGFGPKTPWGLVFISKDFFGGDFSWFRTMEQAFCDSFAASDLEIWNVVLTTEVGTKIIQEQNLNLDDAFALRDRLLTSPSDRSYSVKQRHFLQTTT